MSNAFTQPKKIREEDGFHKQWYEEAKKQTFQTLPAFLDKLTLDYEHDYGTICHAIASAAIAAAWAVERSPAACGGITGFQAGAVMWEFIKHWSYESNSIGLKIVDYDKLLYPQYAYYFSEKEISQRQMEKLREEAKKLIAEDAGSKTLKVPDNVLTHWQSIVDGKAPFGFTVTPTK